MGGESDVLALARQAVQVVRAFLGEVDAAYYELGGGRWRGRVWSEDVAPEVVAQMRAGLPREAPNLAQAARTRAAVFADGWNAAAEGLPSAAVYGAAAFVPLVVGGRVGSLFAVGTRDARVWTEREKALIRAVARGLCVTLERTEHLRQVEQERAALAAFTAFTEAVGVETDPQVFVARAEEVVRSAFTDASVGYLVLEGGLWKLRAWSSDVDDELAEVLRAGLPGDFPAFRQAALTREPTFIEDWDGSVRGSEVYGNLSVCPLEVGGQVRATFNIAQRHTPGWNARDRAIVRALARGLHLALERAEHVRQLEEERRRLDAANEELVAFTYSVSHDLRTPVRHVTSFVDLLRRTLGEGVPPKAERYLNVVEDAAGRMNTLIDGILQVSRSSRLRLNPGPVDLGELLQDARRELEPQVRGRRVEWVIAPLPVVTGDRDTLRQMLVGLLENALKFTRPREVARVEVWAEERPGEWAVLVRDNGVGFDPRYAERLFGIFQRLHRQEDFEGAGVGLANARRIVARHGGRVFAEGQPGVGATFSFTLPRG